MISSINSLSKFKEFQKTRVLVLFLGIFSFILFTGVAQAQRFQVYVFGGLNHVLEYGSEGDYEFGENDFPVTPVHTPVDFGVAFAYFFNNSIGIELDGRYHLSSKVILQDPSDQDTVDINTSKHYAVTLNFIYQFLSGRFRPYLVIGGGIDKLLAKDETYTSKYGYEIEFLVPEKTIDPVANIGVGIQCSLSPSLGARFDVRYVLIFNDPNNVNSLNFVVGAFFRF